MDLLLQIYPEGDTTSREISAASEELRVVLKHLAGVAQVEARRVPAPEHAKGALADALGGLAVSCAPAVLKTVLQTLQAVLSRQPSSTKVRIETAERRFDFDFNPKKISLQELVCAAERLSAAPSTS